jgi:photosystem II stability/assembly factor-like uncharacterized protein
MSIVKTYYVAKGGNEAGVSYDSQNFEDIASYSGVFSGTVPGVGMDPTNGNRVLFTGAVNGSDIIRISTDSGVTLTTPGGNWSSYFINLNSNNGASISWLDLDSIIISGNNGIFKSTDAGLTFNYVVPTEDFTTLYGDTVIVARSYFATETLGLLALSKSDGVTPTKLYRTIDGGINWTEYLSYTPANPYTPITDLWTNINASKIIGVTKTGVFRSTNGGSLFTYPLTYSVLNTAAYGSRLSRVSDTVMYVSGGSGAIYKTMNGGVSWTQQRIGALSDSIFALHFYNNTSGFVAIGQQLFTTTDSGVTLQEISSTGSPVVEMVSLEYNCGECPDGYTKAAIDTCSGVDILPDACEPGFSYIEEINACVGQGDCPPIDLVFSIDLSSSVNCDTELPAVKDLIDGILNYQDLAADPPIDIPGLLNDDKLRVGIVTWGQNSPARWTGTGVTPNGCGATNTNDNLNLTNDYAVISANLNSIDGLTSAGTNTPLGLWEARNVVLNSPNSRAEAVKKIIMITDGIPSAIDNVPPPYSSATSWTTNTLGDASMATYTITNQGVNAIPNQSTGAGFPIGRCAGSSSFTDCARCSVFARTMEIANFIKTIDNIKLSFAILAEVTGADWRTESTLAPYDFPGPSWEAVVTYKALIEGTIRHLSDMFPPSVDPTSPYYVAGGYQATNPKLNGNINRLGLTNQNPATPGAVIGIPLGRLISGPQSSTLGYNQFSNDSTGTWPDINTVSATPGAYGTGATYIGAGSTNWNPSTFIWDCPDANPQYVPACSLKSDGTPDVYVSTFTEAVDEIAPALAIGLCDSSIAVTCPEDCTIVKTVENVRCECPKTLSIPPCVYYIYSCDNLSIPIYCTDNDLSLDVGNVVKISIDGSPITGCFKIGFSDKDYCDEYTNIGVIDTFISCDECQPKAYKLTTCAANSNISIYTQQEDMLDYVGKVVVLTDYPKLCWSVTEELLLGDEEIQIVTVSEDYPDCECCFEYQH